MLDLASNAPALKHAPTDVFGQVSRAVERLICFDESLARWLATQEKEISTAQIASSAARNNGILFSEAQDAVQHASTQKRTAFAQMSSYRKSLADRKETL